MRQGPYWIFLLALGTAGSAEPMGKKIFLANAPLAQLLYASNRSEQLYATATAAAHIRLALQVNSLNGQISQSQAVD